MIIRILFLVFIFCQVAVAKTVITPEDFTYLGSFTSPANVSEPRALAHRYVNGIFKLYSLDSSGYMYEYNLPELKTSKPYNQASTAVSFGDIYQNKLVTTVEKGSGTPPFIGLSGGAVIPTGIWWDQIDNRMYWTGTVNYNNTTTYSDTNLGYATLDDVSHTGTGVGAWALSPPTSQGGYGGRWAFGFTPIPEAFANAYLNGSRIGVGFGGSVSISANGIPSFGPALFAIKPPSLENEDHLDYLSNSPVGLLAHQTTDPIKPVELRALKVETLSTTEWTEEDKTYHGIWIDSTTKHGFIAFGYLVGGNMATTVSAVNGNTITVVDPSDTIAGDLIRIATDYNPNPSYAFEMKRVLAVDGNDITIEPLVGTPSIGAEVFAGEWYAAGGNCGTRYYTPWIIYDPDNFIDTANGNTDENSLTPTTFRNVEFPNVSYPIGGAIVGGVRVHQVKGATFDETTKKLYLLTIGEYDTSRKYNIYVYQLNDFNYSGKRYHYRSINKN